MKIGILTFHRCINYGSYWQARCLVEELRKRGHEAVLLDYYSRKAEIAEYKCALQPVLPTPVPAGDHKLYRQKVEKFLKAIKSLPLSPAFPLNAPANIDRYDLVIAGSDEVWNLTHPWYGGYPVFYGHQINARRIISYAVSFGNYDASFKLAREHSDRLRRFDRISVRDENSFRIIYEALSIEPVVVLDPSLQFPIMAETRETHFDQPYCAVYGHNFSELFIRENLKWAHKNKMHLISVGYRNDWADEQWITAGPEEFAVFMAGAAFVITNFFHGCIFALLYSLPFVCETTQYRSNKVTGLIKIVGAQRHLITAGAAFDKIESCLSKPPGEDIMKNINDLRRISNNYLEEALNLA